MIPNYNTDLNGYQLIKLEGVGDVGVGIELCVCDIGASFLCAFMAV